MQNNVCFGEKLVVGLTGGSGVGQSTVSEVWRKNGAFIADCDKIAREIVQRLPSLYPLQTVEEEAILTLLAPKTHARELEGEGDREEWVLFCPNCGTDIYNDEDKFCKKCGQPLTDEW